MGVPGSNIGKARLQVLLMDQSPFNGKTKQEFAFFFTPESFGAMEGINNIEALPAPFNGLRLKESMNNYDNYLVDTKDVKLEDAKLPDQGQVLSDAGAAFKAEYADRLRSPSPAQKDFFTWKVSKNLFSIEGGTTAGSETASTTEPQANPPPMSFEETAARNDNTPVWTYNLKVRPNAANTSPLSPFMTRTTSSPNFAVHWGCQMISSLARNQPFEMLFYHEGQVHTLAEEAPSLKPRFQSFPKGSDGKEIDLTKKGYFAIEVGTGSIFNFLFLFIQGMSPLCCYIRDNALNVISEFSDYKGENLFDPENSFFPVKFEQVSTGILVTSNKFGGKYWAIQGSTKSPVYIGEGPLSVYSGNVQAGFAMRPVQYMPNGVFNTPSSEIRIEPGDTREPTATTALKGDGTIQQQRNAAGEVHAVDSELVNGKGVKTFIEVESGFESFLAGQRKINVIVKKITQAQEPAAFGPPAPPVKDFEVHVQLVPTNSAQPGQYVIPNGRSPYIWQVRAEIPLAAEGAAPGVVEDVSCDVLGLELNWNATSFNELNHTGTLRLQNRPRVRAADYRNLQNGAVYLKIFGWWEQGVGHDPGGAERQIFEGMTTGFSIETKAEQEVVVLKIEDYMNVLIGSKFMNCPYYDGMQASKAVVDIVRQTGLGESRIMLGNELASEAGDDPGEYGLSMGPNPLSQPQFKFEEGSPYKDAIVKIATLDGKVVYFDQYGRFHYDPIPGGAFFDEDTSPVANFVSSPRATGEAKYVVWNQISFSRAINDVYNIIRVATVDKETGIRLILGDFYDAGITSPGAPGYLGYRKRLDIFEPALGGLDKLARYFYTYRNRVFWPPLTARFETFGYSGLKPLDTLMVDGQKLRIVSISSRFDAAENQYFMTIEGEWYFNSEKGENPLLKALGA